MPCKQEGLLFFCPQEVEILKTELEASQRQLEGKEEALKILQSMVRIYFRSFHRKCVHHLTHFSNEWNYNPCTQEAVVGGLRRSRPGLVTS